MSTPRRVVLEEALNQALRIQVMRVVMFTQAIAAQAGINPADAQCLSILTIEGPMTPSRLAEAMTMSKGGAITAMIDRLETAGYLRRTRDTHDRRQVLIELTPGPPLQRLVAKHEPAREVVANLMADYTDEQLELITQFTVRSNEAFRNLPQGNTQRA